MGKIEVAFHDVRYEKHHVAAMPVGLSDSRLHLLYVEQLVDERKQSRALSRHHASHLTDVARRHLSLLKHVRIAEDDGERRAELVGDIGEERDAHLVHLMLQQLLALTGTQGVEHERNNDRGEHDDKHGCGEAEPSKRALCLVLVIDGIHLGAVLLVLVAHAHVLHVYDVLLARHAVAEFVILFIVAQRTCVVALPAVYLVVDTCNLRLVFERVQVVSQLVGYLEIVHGSVVVARLQVNLRQRKTRLHRVPAVARGLHYLVRLAVLGDGFRGLALLVVETSEVGVA